MYKLVLFLILLCYSESEAQSYEDKRCKCVCPGAIQNNKPLTINVNVPPLDCNCYGVVLPKAGDEVKGREQEYCQRCECIYENRNTTIIKVVVIIVMFIIMLLVIYMGFLICLDPLLNRRAKASYQEHTNEEDEGSEGPGASSHQMGVRGVNVLNRVTHQQDKWKRQVKEQRRNIYDRHTMLN